MLDQEPHLPLKERVAQGFFFMYEERTMKKPVLALVAHDNKKPEIVEWCKANVEALKKYDLVGTGHTAKLISEETGLSVKGYLSGPMGGDQQIGALIATGVVNKVVFFWDPLQAQPHDPDVKALMRIAAVYDIPFATNKSTADCLLK